MPKKRATKAPRRRVKPPQAQPLIAVRDVRASSRWYCKLLLVDSLAQSEPSDHDDVYDRLLADGQLLLQLHAWDEEVHNNLQSDEEAAVGHGVLLWFEVADFDQAVARAKSLKAKVLVKPHVNENAGHREIWIQDPDGYVVVLASPDGEAVSSAKPKRAARRAR